MKKIEVVAAVIYCEDQVLCVQRPRNKLPYISEKFEFPGGKVEIGESREEALHRELWEELNIIIDIRSFFLTLVHQYPDFELTMHSFLCEVESKELTLHEHIDQKWLALGELNSLDWAAADIPIVNKLVSNGKLNRTV
jgi:8-oxo-dGTP diphosphatase